MIIVDVHILGFISCGGGGGGGGEAIPITSAFESWMAMHGTHAIPECWRSII